MNIMYEHYAIIENDQVIEYPVNPRVFLVLQNCYNVPEYWPGGVLDGKTYVYCHNFAPTPPYDKNLLEVTPIKNPENGYWYREYVFVDATQEEIAERTLVATEAAVNGVNALLKMIEEKQPEILLMSVEKQAEWAAYKAQVEAIPNSPNYPFGFIWPTVPDDGNQINIGVERV